MRNKIIMIALVLLAVLSCSTAYYSCNEIKQLESKVNELEARIEQYRRISEQDFYILSKDKEL